MNSKTIYMEEIHRIDSNPKEAQDNKILFIQIDSSFASVAQAQPVVGAANIVNLSVKRGEDVDTSFSGENGSTISRMVSSGDEDLINIDTGEVTRPTDEDKTVILTATISKDWGISVTKEFVLTLG